jgi:hypothetical protein
MTWRTHKRMVTPIAYDGSFGVVSRLGAGTVPGLNAAHI